MVNALKLFLFSFPLLVVAQEPADPDTLRTYKLDEIVVTATRVGGNILQVPMAVGIVDAGELTLSRRISLSDVFSSIPGVLAQSRSGGTDVRLTIRGFGARGNGDRSNAATIRGIKVLVDGIPETDPDGRTSLDLVDLHAVSRLEVIRSNASTLFGNASGGVVNIISQTFFSKPFVEMHNVIGAFGLRKNNVRIGVPLNSGRFSVSASNAAFDGWRQQSGSHSTQFTSSLSVDFQESSRLTVLAAAAVNTFQIPGALTQEQFDAAPTQANPAYTFRNERRHNRVGRLGISLTTRLTHDHNLEVLGYIAPKVLQRSERGTFRDFSRYHIGGGVVYNGTFARFLWQPKVTVGFDEAYQDGTILFYNLIRGERGDSLRTNKREGANTLGAFAQIEAHPAHRLSVTLGARFDMQTYLSEVFAAGLRKTSTSERLALSHFTPKLAILYRLGPTHSAYLNIGGGVEAPAFNEVDPPPSFPHLELNPFLKPMTSTTYEIGLKGVESIQNHTFVRSFSYSFAAYLIDIRNEIVPFDGGTWFFSAGSSRRRGVEAGAQIDFLSGVTWRSAFTYLHATYQEYKNELGNFAGNEVPGIPQTVFNTRVRYVSQLGVMGEVAFERIGSYYVDDRNAAVVAASTVITPSMGFELTFGDFHIKAFLALHNLTDGRYASSAFINPVLQKNSAGQSVAAYLEPGLPRHYYGGLDLRIRF